MAYDPTLLASIGDSQYTPADDMAKAATLKDMLDRNQLSSLQLNSAKADAADSAKVKDILKGSDYTTPEGLSRTAAAVNRVSPKAAMDLLKTGQQYQSGQIQNQLDQWSLLEKRQDSIVGVLDSVVSQARTMKNNGATDFDVNAYIQQQMPTAIQQLRAPGPDGKPILPDDQLQMLTAKPHSLQDLEGYEAKSKAGAAAIKQRLEQYKADTQARGASAREASETEKERHDRSIEDRDARRDEQKRKEATEGILSDESAQLAVDRILNGEPARDVLANFGRGKQGGNNITKVQNLLAQSARERGLDAAEITARNIEMKGLAKEQQTEAAIAGKITYAEKEIQKIGPKVLELSDKVPRGSFVPWNRLRNYGEGQLGSPELKQLKAYLTTLTNSYDVLGGRGGTDVDKRAHNRELLDAADSPQALKAAVEAIVSEAKLSHEAASESMDVDRDRMRRGGASPSPQAPGHALAPGATYQHPSGATVQILP